jgi:riboflavin biosynthesis pyrimidine reductase
LRADRPTVISNFVSTIDGVASYATAEAAGGGEISGFFEPDAYVMGLLRSLSDAVLIGAGTLRAAPDQAWSPRYIHPSSTNEFATLRRDLGLAAEPTTVVVTRSGAIDLLHPGLSDPAVPVLIVTTESGRRTLLAESRLPGHADVVSAGDDHISPGAVVEMLDRRGMRLVLCEGGPHLFGELLAARLVDELFLTIAPQVAGRSPAQPRLHLVEGTSFALAGAPWARIVDVRRSGDHLFLRYSFMEARS